MKAYALKNKGRVRIAGSNLAQLKRVAERDVWEGSTLDQDVRTTGGVTGHRWKKDGREHRLYFSVTGHTQWFPSEWTIS